jgi:hypothetical protein
MTDGAAWPRSNLMADGFENFLLHAQSGVLADAEPLRHLRGQIVAFNGPRDRVTLEISVELPAPIIIAS